MTPKPRGRPARAEAAGVDYHVRLSPIERERVDAAARICHQSSADFARDALVTAAEDCLDPGRRIS